MMVDLPELSNPTTNTLASVLPIPNACCSRFQMPMVLVAREGNCATASDRLKEALVMGRYKLRTPFVTMARDQIRAGVWYKVSYLYIA